MGAGVPVSVLIATLVAACAHAGWNSIAHGITDKLTSFTLVNLGCLLCAVPLVCVVTPPEARSWGYLAVSAVLHVGYMGLLMLSYRLGDFSQVYPLARGTSPLVVTVLAAVFVGEHPGPGQIAGVGLISLGLACLVFWGRRTRPARPSAVLAAVATGLMIASYTTVDGIGVRLAGSTLGYTGWLMVAESIVVPVFAIVTRPKALLATVRPVWHIGLAGGVLCLLAYALVLWAQTRGVLSAVAALRESSIILGAVIGTVVFGERFGTARVLATCGVVAGIAATYLL